MIIYCAGAIKGDTSYQKNYKEIISIVDSLDHTALSELNPDFKSAYPLTDKQIYKRDMKWLESCQMVIAEVSGASLGVGFELAYTLFQLKKPVLALYSSEVKKVSAMISGCSSELLTVKQYHEVDEVTKCVKNFIRKYSVE